MSQDIIPDEPGSRSRSVSSETERGLTWHPFEQTILEARRLLSDLSTGALQAIIDEAVMMSRQNS